MEYKYKFFIAGKTRNKENILKICDIFDKYNVSYYCFLKDNYKKDFGGEIENDEEYMKQFEGLDLKSDIVLNMFKQDLDNQKASKNFLVVLPAGKSAHIEAGISYGLGRKCYAIGEYDATDSLYNIFENIFESSDELDSFLKEYSDEHIK